MRMITVFLVAVLVLAGCSQSSQSSSRTKHPGAEQAGPKHGVTRAIPGQTRTGPQEKRRPAAPKKPNSVAPSVPGLSAAREARVFESQGLRCKHSGESGTLYDCNSEGNPNLSLLYVGQVTGSNPNHVRSVAAEVDMTASGGDLTSAAQLFFGVIARRMDYRGADASKATAFVYKNLAGTDAASVTIGSAKWTLLSNAEAKVLQVAPAR